MFIFIWVYKYLTIYPLLAANNPKPTPFKKIGKAKDAGIISASCGNHTTALLNKEGQLYMFGDLPISGITDEASGEETAVGVKVMNTYEILVDPFSITNIPVHF